MACRGGPEPAAGKVGKIAAFCVPLSLAATLLQAWEFEPGPVCTLSHSEAAIAVTVTFDPSLPEYAIILTRPDPWPDAPVFALGFNGTRPLRIETDRHILSDDRRSLTVKDLGFGNVLDGLQFNRVATAILGDDAVSFSLLDAAQPVAAFRECPAPFTS